MGLADRAEQRAQPLDERGEGHAPVNVDAPPDQEVFVDDRGRELPEQAGLPHARLAAHEDRPPGAATGGGQARL